MTAPRFWERSKIRLNRFVRRIQAWRGMRRLDSHPIPDNATDEIRMLVVCRNEALRLPFMLDYHFRLGVSRVFLIDNNSSDATLDLVKDDPRIHVFSSSETYRGPLYWQEPILRRFCQDHWTLIMDADELFVYPEMDTVPLPQFVRSLEAENAGAIHSLFVEMFSKEPMSGLHYEPGQNLVDAAPFFDADGYVRKKYNRVFSGPGSDFIYMGGTRARVFGGEFGCSKVPLFKYSPNLFLRRGLHTIEGTRLSTRQTAILHFKYLQDFHEKVIREAARGLYWNGSAEYKAYAALFEKNPDFTLWHPAAVRFESWRTLAERGLIF